MSYDERNTSMKKWISLLLVVTMILSGTVCSFAESQEEPEVTSEAPAYLAGNPDDVAAVILHTNDVHVGFEDNIGYDGLSLYKKELEEQYDNVLLVDAGDAIQGAPLGSISKGAEIVKMMNKLGYDLAITGNHEFDFGFEVLDDRSEELECGYTCANFCVLGGEPVFEPWRILEAGDLKIGFIGVVVPETFTKTPIKDILNEVGEPMYDFLADETGEKLVTALQTYIDEVHENGADYVILVSHLGDSESVEPAFRLENVLAQLSGLDMAIDGHSHEIYNRIAPEKDGREIPIAQTGTKMQSIGQLTIYKDGHMEEKLIEEVPEPADLPSELVTRGDKERYVDPEMKSFLDDIVASYADIMERKIGEVSFDMLVRDADENDFSRWQENNLCDLVTDAYRTIGNTEIGFLNAGSVRNSLPAGEITYSSAVNVLPYSNEIMTAEVTGQTILDALEFGVMNVPIKSARFPQVSGMTFAVNKDIESSVTVDEKNQFISVDGERRVSDVLIGGEPLDPDRKYTITTTGFVLTGGDGYTMFKDAENVTSTMMTDNEILMKYIEENLGGVIPDSYKEAKDRILWKAASGDETEVEPVQDAPAEIVTSVAGIEKYGNLVLGVMASEVLDDGIEVGDIATVKIADKEYEMPVVTEFADVDQGDMLCRLVSKPEQQEDYVLLAINMGDLASTIGIATKEETDEEPFFEWTLADGISDPVPVVITLKERGGYNDELKFHQLYRSENREDYPDLTDAEYANFRMIQTTGIGKNAIYRSSSPVNPEINRNHEADAAAREAGVKTFINLADSEKQMKGYEGFAETYYSTQAIVNLNMGLDFQTEKFGKKLAKGLTFLAEHEAPFLVHCTEGKDRAGFVSAVIEAFMGASADEIVKDYMTTFYNYYGVEPGTEMYTKIADSNIRKTLAAAFGLETLDGQDLSAAAEGYLKSIGLSDETLSLIREKLGRDYEK